MTTATQARSYAIQGFVDTFGRTPTKDEMLIELAVGKLETGWGDWWQGAGRGSNNIGAITAGRFWTGNTFVYQDSYPDENGVNHVYTTKFRKYATPEEGWQDFADILYADRPSVLAAAVRGDVYGVSEALYWTHYYAGFGKTPGERIAGHYRNLDAKVRSIAAALGLLPPLCDLPTIRRGARGDVVKTWQRILGVVADGIFGPITDRVTRDWQKTHGLLADGIVGPKTWGKAADV